MITELNEGIHCLTFISCPHTFWRSWDPSWWQVYIEPEDTSFRSILIPSMSPLWSNHVTLIPFTEDFCWKEIRSGRYPSSSHLLIDKIRFHWYWDWKIHFLHLIAFFCSVQSYSHQSCNLKIYFFPLFFIISACKTMALLTFPFPVITDPSHNHLLNFHLTFPFLFLILTLTSCIIFIDQEYRENKYFLTSP